MPPPQVSDLTRSMRARPGRPSRLPGSSSRQMASQQVNPGPLVSDRLGEGGCVGSLGSESETSIGLARCSSHLFLCPQGAWRAALLPGNHMARAGGH